MKYPIEKGIVENWEYMQKVSTIIMNHNYYQSNAPTLAHKLNGTMYVAIMKTVIAKICVALVKKCFVWKILFLQFFIS